MKLELRRDHEQPADTAEGGDDLLDHAVGKVFLLRVAAQIGEWQHGNRRLVGQRQFRPPRLRCQFRCRRHRRSLLARLADKAHPFAGGGADQASRRAAVTDCAPHRGDPAVERRIGDDTPAPHRLQQIVLADDALAVLQQVDEEVEDLRLHSDLLAAAAQLATRSVEHMVAEPKPQIRPSGWQLGRL